VCCDCDVIYSHALVSAAGRAVGDFDATLPWRDVMTSFFQALSVCLSVCLCVCHGVGEEAAELERAARL